MQEICGYDSVAGTAPRALQSYTSGAGSDKNLSAWTKVTPRLGLNSKKSHQETAKVLFY
jgi:hypothetical protein